MTHESTNPRTPGIFRSVRFALCALTALTALTFAACGGGGGEQRSGPSTPTSVSGRLTYDYVPMVVGTDADGNLQASLDYAHTEQRPVRRALVEAVSSDGARVFGNAFSSMIRDTPVVSAFLLPPSLRHCATRNP
ncbi:hypothetical protein BRCH_00079 [Candidatus Burkholderia brachyanthoides]|nr:hypothetical protein BRCH_00079 [Candidatus Burkholderia brachyanthoides]